MAGCLLIISYYVRFFLSMVITWKIHLTMKVYQYVQFQKESIKNWKQLRNNPHVFLHSKLHIMTIWVLQTFDYPITLELLCCMTL